MELMVAIFLRKIKLQPFLGQNCLCKQHTHYSRKKLLKQLNLTNSLCFKIEVTQSIKTGYKSCQPLVSKQQNKAKTQSIEEQPVLEGHEHLQIEGIKTFQSSHNEELPIHNEITHQEIVVRTKGTF